LTCRDCGKSFVFTVGEQEFYESRGFSEPTRCADCRASRKASRDGSGGGYGGGRSYGGGGFGGGRDRDRESGFGGGGRGEGRGGARQMFKVTCAECGKETEVPFEPRTGRPVYCRDCFEKRNGRR
jgi:CxxC-x17-CxxC domain-containing protein